MTWVLFCRDLKAAFRGSLLGYVWLFLPPLATTVVWIILNRSRVVAFSDPNIPYPLFVLVGTILWSSFSRAAVLPLQVFQLSKPVFSKLNVPLGAFLIVAPLRVLFDTVLYGIVAAGIFVCYGSEVHLTILLLPLAMLAAVLMGFAVAMVLLPLSALYSDVQQGLVLFFSVAIYLAPVVYPLPKAGKFADFMAWNPITPVIVSSREWIFQGDAVGVPGVLMVMGGCILVIGLMLAGMRTAMPHVTARMGM
jgi:lipopolysaccharide transport system permease protein